jgi:hypothetical protein
VHKLQYFSSNWPPKSVGTRNYIFGGRLISKVFEEFQQPAKQTKIVQPIGGFFYQIKVCQRKKMIIYKLLAEEWGDWRHFCT